MGRIFPIFPHLVPFQAAKVLPPFHESFCPFLLSFYALRFHRLAVKHPAPAYRQASPWNGTGHVPAKSNAVTCEVDSLMAVRNSRRLSATEARALKIADPETRTVAPALTTPLAV
jgi:hypothetical protein